MKYASFVVTILLSFALLSTSTQAHCEIPCGIYDDEARLTLLREHITTMEKSMKQITELSSAADQNANQLTRWVMSKEEHATKFQTIVSQYFLTQRIKPTAAGSEGYAGYQARIELLHQMLVYAMKCKQATDTGHIDKLRELVDQFERAYLEGHKH